MFAYCCHFELSTVFVLQYEADMVPASVSIVVVLQQLEAYVPVRMAELIDSVVAP